MDSTQLRAELKELIVTALNLEGRAPDDIDDAAPLFGGGLGLDSLDALELAMAVEERYGVRIAAGDAGREAFSSVGALSHHIARHIAAHRG